MQIVIDRPLFGTTKPLAIEKDGELIGEVSRWFRPREERPSRNPADDVNIRITSSSTSYEILHQFASMREGHHWELMNNGELIASMTSAKGLTAKHRVDLHRENFPNLSIEATWARSGKILLDGEQTGQTKETGFLFNTKYMTELNSTGSFIDPLLLAGITYTFWSSFR